MKRTRALFKLALRYCRNHIEKQKADVCGERLYDKVVTNYGVMCTKLVIIKHLAMLTVSVELPHDVAKMWK